MPGIDRDGSDVATVTQHGLLPKLSGSSSDVLKGDGTWGASGGGGGAPTDASYVVATAHASLSAELVLGTDVIMRGTLASRPAASLGGRLYFVTDSGSERWTRDNGSSWDDVGVDWDFVTGKPTTFTPSAHASNHQSGGSDPVKLDDLAAPDDNTDLDASTTKHGLLPKLGGGTTNFLRADGAWAAPSGGGGGISKLPIHLSVAARTYTNLGAGPTESNVADRRIVDLTGLTNVRLLARVSTAGVTGDLKAQYSTDGTTFSDLTTLIDMSTTGLKASSSQAIPSAAKTLVTLRMVAVGGNTTEDPVVESGVSVEVS